MNKMAAIFPDKRLKLHNKHVTILSCMESTDECMKQKIWRKQEEMGINARYKQEAKRIPPSLEPKYVVGIANKFHCGLAVALWECRSIESSRPNNMTRGMRLKKQENLVHHNTTK